MSERVSGGEDAETSAGATSLPSPLSWLSREMQEAIEVIPVEEKRAYLRAIETAPDLVRIESPPDKFLSFHSLDPWAAAKNLVVYWEARLEVFGEDRAYYPLRLLPSNNNKSSSDDSADAPPVAFRSALDERDTEIINSGYYMILPRDSFSRPVLLYELSRIPSDPDLMDPSRRVRCSFYFFTVLFQEVGEGNEISVITVFGNKMRRASVNRQLLLRGFALFGQRQVLPVRLASWHIVRLGRRNFIARHALPIFLHIFEALGAMKPKCFQIHEVGDDREVEKVQEGLRKAGFGIEGLPKLGLDGLWTIGCFKEWIDSRLRLEHRIYDALPKVDGSVATSLDGAPAVGPRDLDKAEAQEELVRKRRRAEAAYARRKRARRKINLKVLQGEVIRHRSQKEELLQTQDKLQGLLREAEGIVQLHVMQEASRDQLATFGSTRLGEAGRPSSDSALLNASSALSYLASPGALMMPPQHSFPATVASSSLSAAASDRAASLILQQLSDQRLTHLMNAPASLLRQPDPLVALVAAAGFGRPLLQSANRASQESALRAALSSRTFEHQLLSAATTGARAMDQARLLASNSSGPAASSPDLLLRALLLQRSEAIAAPLPPLICPGQLQEVDPQGRANDMQNIISRWFDL